MSMRPKFWRLSAVPALALALLVGACSDLGSPTEISSPGQAELARGSNRGGGSREERRVRVSDRSSGRSWRIATGRLPKAYLAQDEKIIGPQGGMIQASGHVLYVPQGAVAQPTKFKIKASKTPIDNSGSSSEVEVKVEVDLTAYTVDADGNELVDVGAAGFLKPVYVGLAYSWVSDVIPDLTKVKVLWVKSDVEVEPTRTFSVDYNGKWIVAELDHFSRYALGWPD